MLIFILKGFIIVIKRRFSTRHGMLAIALLCSTCISAQINRQTPILKERDEFPADAIWINIQTPIHLNTLDDKIVVLNFISEDCALCSKNTDWLNAMAHTHQEVQLISVVKRDKTFSLDRFKRFLFEGGISHPVVIVNDFNTFKVSKPQQVPHVTMLREGKLYIFGTTKEEMQQTKLEALDTLFQWNRKAAELSFSQLTSDDILTTKADGLFKFPHYMDFNSNGRTMFISDAGHHRIAVVDSDGEANVAIGSTSKGLKDGTFGNAQFNNPGGVSYDENTDVLYIADTYNNRICAADFKTREVKTILGPAVLQSKSKKANPKTTIEIGLPTDVLSGNKKLYIASAWDNCIYEFNPQENVVKKYATIPSRPLENLSFSFPVNLSIASDTSLAVVNSDGSVYEVGLDGSVALMIDATTNSLAEGISSAVKSNGRWYFTNSITNQVLQLKNGELEPLTTNTKSGWQDGKRNAAAFYSPQDIIASGDKLFVLDSYNHLVRIISGKKNKTKTLQLTAFNALARFGDAPNTGEKVFLETLKAADGMNHVTISVSIPGYEVIISAQNEIHSDGVSGITVRDFNATDRSVEFDFDPEQLANGMIQLEFYLTVRSLEKPQAIYLKTALVNIPVESGGSTQTHTVRYAPNIGW